MCFIFVFRSRKSQHEIFTIIALKAGRQLGSVSAVGPTTRAPVDLCVLHEMNAPNDQ